MIKTLLSPLWLLQFIPNAVFLILLGAILVIAAKIAPEREAHVLIRRWFVGADQYLNALFDGDPDETISSRAGKCARKGDKVWCKILCQFLHILDPDHCEKSIEYDEGKQAPKKTDTK